MRFSHLFFAGFMVLSCAPTPETSLPGEPSDLARPSRPKASPQVVPEASKTQPPVKTADSKTSSETPTPALLADSGLCFDPPASDLALLNTQTQAYRKSLRTLLALTPQTATGFRENYAFDAIFKQEIFSPEPAEPLFFPSTKTYVAGRVFDDTLAPLDGVLVQLRSLNPDIPHIAHTTTASGTYAFSNFSSQDFFELTASRKGFTTRKRYFYPRPYNEFGSTHNIVDFGYSDIYMQSGRLYQSNGNLENAFSDKPEVVAVDYLPDELGSAQLRLRFSEPMYTETVDDNLAFYAQGALNPILRALDLMPSWQDENQQLTLVLKAEQRAKLGNNTRVELRFQADDRQIKDQTGITRQENFFKLPGYPFQESYLFESHIEGLTPILPEPLPLPTPWPEPTLAPTPIPTASPHALPAPEASQYDLHLFQRAQYSDYWTQRFWQALEQNRLLPQESLNALALSRSAAFLQDELQTLGPLRIGLGLQRSAHALNPFVENYMLGLQVFMPARCLSERPPLNLTLLVEHSASFATAISAESQRPSKEELLQQILAALPQQLKAGDRLSLVYFNDVPKTALAGLKIGKDSEAALLSALNVPEFKARPNRALALEKGYELARKHYLKAGLNQVLLITDAQEQSDASYLGLINANRGAQAAIRFSVLGLGTDNHNFALQRAAELGDGVHLSLWNAVDVKRAMTQQFYGLVDHYPRFQLEMTLPGWLQQQQGNVQPFAQPPVHEDAQAYWLDGEQRYFWSLLQANQKDWRPDDEIEVRIRSRSNQNTDPTLKLRFSVASLLEKQTQNLRLAHLIHLNVALARGEISKVQVEQILAAQD